MFLNPTAEISVVTVCSSMTPPDSSSVTITREGAWFVAIDEATAVASQGRTRPAALANLAEALELYRGGGALIADADAFLTEELDIDVDEIDEREPPWSTSDSPVTVAV